MPELDIKSIIGRYAAIINEHGEGEANSRYRSWDYCHAEFMSKHNEMIKNPNLILEEKDLDLLSLHLAFYLASWGMYRGSSELLQRDYKTHINAVKLIMKSEYDMLWDYEPNKDNIEEAYKLLFEDPGIYWKIKKAYPGYDEANNDGDFPSETLVTKILMGTFGCIPAFDRFFRRGLGYYKDSVYNNKGYKFTQSVETASKNKKASDTFKQLALFACENEGALEIEGIKPEYPPMKCLDMLFWEIGYELDLRDALKNGDDKSTKRLAQVSNLFKQEQDFTSYQDAVNYIDSIYPQKNKTSSAS